MTARYCLEVTLMLLGYFEIGKVSRILESLYNRGAWVEADPERKPLTLFGTLE